MCYIEDRDGQLCGAAIRVGEHTHIVIGKAGQRMEALRVAGRDAANLLHPMNFQAADKLNTVIRSDWGTRYQNVKTCECHACRQRRDRDSEMHEQSAARKPKRDWLVIMFFAVVIWRRRVILLRERLMK